MSTDRPGPPPPEGAEDKARAYASHTRPSSQEPKAAPKPGTIFKIAVGIIICFVLAQIVVVSVALGTLSVGLASCSASFSDMPIQDSQELTAFINDRKANENDLATLDALKGAVGSVIENRYSSNRWTFNDLHAAVSRGTWPEGEIGDTSSSTCPQLWVRLAESCSRWLTLQTDEQWHVVDFSYPFPSNGPIPVPPTRDQYDCVECRCLCTGGPDQGLYVDVRYYRWSPDDEQYQSDLDDARNYRKEGAALLEELRALSDIGDRPFILDGSDLYLWSTGSDDRLRDPDTFVAFANKASGLVGNYADITLLDQETPVELWYSTLSYDYPNELSNEKPSLEDAQKQVLSGRFVWHLNSPWRSELLSAYRSSSDERITLEDLRGELAPEMEKESTEEK